MPQYKSPIHSKLPTANTSIFAIMTKAATEHGAINMAQGFPDFNCDTELIDLVSKYMKKGFNQYAPMPGLMSLREAIAEKTEFLYGAKYNPETEITITAGATQAIFTVITSVVREGDEVIIFEPAYDCYQPAIELCGGKTIFMQLKAPTYEINWEEVKKVISHKTRMIIINTPHNPTGSILSADDLATLEKLTADTDILVISDEVYEHILFDTHKHQSACQYPGLAERSFVISSFGKTYHTTGWKMGYILAPPSLTAEVRKVHQFLVFSVNTPIQHALTEYLQKKDLYLELGNFYQKKRDYFNKLISGSRFKINPASGTYFQLLDYSAITNEADTEYALRLVKENKIAAIPVSVFYHTPIDNKMLRFCFAKKEETIEKAAEILCKI
ncbi:MAG: methionine aminotransferase [Bacteroidetes bacterium]|nr:methionine aminotransferase [Bacteroidota bacterium]